jgi:hypothetical protein
MQLCASIGAESNDVAGVGGNFRLEENDLEHAVRSSDGRPLLLVYLLRSESTAMANRYPPVPLLAAHKSLTAGGQPSGSHQVQTEACS